MLKPCRIKHLLPPLTKRSAPASNRKLASVPKPSRHRARAREAAPLEYPALPTETPCFRIDRFVVEVPDDLPAASRDIARMRATGCPSTAAIHRFVDKVEQGEALVPEDIQACRQSIVALHRYTAQLSSAEIADITRTALLKFSLDELSVDPN